MACGQKKQNTNEGGVHLTERTCSPYNPIIKQIVDDCLGLPIYPVTSVDAVIDEDGNTLRKLLEDLLNQIKEGNSDLDDDIENKINELLQYIANNYVNNTTYSSEQTTQNNAIETIRTLLYAISALKSISTGHLEEYIYAKDTYGVNTDVPYIVKYINDIHDKLEELIGEGGENLSIPDIIDILLAVANFDTDFNVSEYDDKLTPSNGHINIIDQILALQEEVGNNQDNSSILGRLSALESAKVKLQALLIAVANYNDEKYINDSDFTGLGLTSSDTESVNKLIEIIYQIKNAITRIGIIEEALGLNPGGGSGSIQEQLDQLKAEAKTHAHLDPTVLNQMPENATVEEQEIYRTLAAGEYPPTTVDFIQYGTSPRTVERLEYLGLYGGSIVIDDSSALIPLDVSPIGHLRAEGHYLFYRDESSYKPVLSVNNEPLKVGNDKITVTDFNTVISIAQGSLTDIPHFEVTPAQNNLKYNDLYVLYNGQYRKLGDVDGDGEVKPVDTGNLVNWFTAESTQEEEEEENAQQQYNLHPNYHSDQKFGYLIYYDSTNTQKAIYPCIEGKLYADSFTNKIYRYTNGEMILVSSDKFVGTGGIEVNRTFNSELNQDVVTIGANFEGAKGIDIEEANPGGPVVITQKTTCWHVDSGANVVAGSLYIAGETVNVLHGFITDSTNIPPAGTGSNLPGIDINYVTRLINLVLGSKVTSASGQFEHGSYMFRVLNYLINFTTDIEPTTTNGATIKSTILDELNSYLSPVNDYIEGRQAYQQMTADVETLVSQHLEMQSFPLSNVPHGSNNNMLLQTSAETWYLWGWDSEKNTWIPYEFRAEDVPDIAGKVMDFTGNDICDINDVTLAINIVLTDVSSYTPHLVEVTITPTLYKKNTNSSEAIVNCEGIEVLDQNNRLWYVYDEAGHVRMEQTRLVVEQAGDILGLQLHENGQKTSEVLLSDHLNDYIINNVAIKLDATNKNMLQLVVGGRVVQSLDLTDAIEAVVEEQSADVGN